MHKVVIDKASLLVSCFIVIPVSFVYGFLPFNLALACGILIISEVVGIIEELV